MRRVWRAPATDAAELTRLAGSPDHQGVVAEVDPYPYADSAELLERTDGLIVALDQVQDPHNLGAVARSAEAAGADGLVISEPARGLGDRRRRQGLGRRRRAPADRPGREPRRLARAGQGRGRLDLRRRRRRAEAAYTQTDLTGKVVLVLGSEGKGLRRLVAERCDALISIPVRGRVASLNVSAAAAALLFEAVRQRSGGIGLAARADGPSKLQRILRESCRRLTELCRRAYTAGT